MNEKIDIIGLRGIPLITPGDNVPKVILKALKETNLDLENGDIILITQSIISKANGLIKNLKDIIPGKKALELYKNMTPKSNSMGIPVKNAELIQAILDESKEIIRSEHVLITETKHGFICANAGVDASNAGGGDNITLLPVKPDEDATKIRKEIKKLTNKDVAVIITDSFGRPFREGAVGVAIGISGISALLDRRGEMDLYGRVLQSKIVGQVDNLASAAQLIMGEASEGLPVIIVRGYEFKFKENVSIKQIIREKSSDLFIGTFERSEWDKVLKERRSYKSEFSNQSVDKNLIEDCIEIARWAPSAHNGQFWRYIILEKGSIRNELINRMNLKLEQDLLKDGKSKTFIDEKINKTKYRFLNAPFLILLCLDNGFLHKYPDEERNMNEFILGVQSVSASATYFLLAIHAKELAACWYCAPVFSKQVVKETLKLPDSFEPMAFFTIGYPLKDVKAPSRKNLNEIIYDINAKR